MELANAIAIAGKAIGAGLCMGIGACDGKRPAGRGCGRIAE